MNLQYEVQHRAKINPKCEACKENGFSQEREDDMDLFFFPSCHKGVPHRLASSKEDVNQSLW